MGKTIEKEGEHQRFIVIVVRGFCGRKVTDGFQGIQFALHEEAGVFVEALRDVEMLDFPVLATN